MAARRTFRLYRSADRLVGAMGRRQLDWWHHPVSERRIVHLEFGAAAREPVACTGSAARRQLRTAVASTPPGSRGPEWFWAVERARARPNDSRLCMAHRSVCRVSVAGCRRPPCRPCRVDAYDRYPSGERVPVAIMERDRCRGCASQALLRGGFEPGLPAPARDVDARDDAHHRRDVSSRHRVWGRGPQDSIYVVMSDEASVMSPDFPRRGRR